MIHVGMSAAEFHEINRLRYEEWPYEMLATSTHDTKLGEDVRARIDVLSEIPREWRQAVRRWQRLNRRLKSRVDDVRVPESTEEYFIYQTLIGTWPLDPAEMDSFQDRLQPSLVKSWREAKQHTSWADRQAHPRTFGQAHQPAIRPPRIRAVSRSPAHRLLCPQVATC